MEFFNPKLAREPLYWAIVWVFASIALLAFHVVMQGFGAMQAPTISAPPGMVASPAPDGIGGTTNYGNSDGTLNYFNGGAPNWWTAPFEAKYPEDGFTADY